VIFQKGHKCILGEQRQIVKHNHNFEDDTLMLVLIPFGWYNAFHVLKTILLEEGYLYGID